MTPAVRVHSLDALRGFTMFWIIGGDAIVAALSKLLQSPGFDTVAIQFHEHVDWAGLRFYDLIFPLFLFVIGATIPFALGRRLESEESRREILMKILRRTAILLLFGLIYNGLLRFVGWENLRIAGVLQRLAIGYGVASILFVYTSIKVQATVLGLLLLGYWALMLLIPVPGVPQGTMTEWGNAANYVDRLVFLPGQMYEKYGDPEGLLSTIPAIGTAILGLLAGTWLRSDRTPQQKASGLVLGGLACLAIGLAWSPLFPIVKKLWTSPYVLTAGGLSQLLLAAFYWIVDVKGWKAWAFPFIVIGSNAILIYMLSAIVDFRGIAEFFLGGALDGHKTLQPLGLALGVVAVEWLLLYVLYRNRIFVRV